MYSHSVVTPDDDVAVAADEEAVADPEAEAEPEARTDEKPEAEADARADEALVAEATADEAAEPEPHVVELAVYW